MLSVYKRWISPALPAACRFVPTCSEYAMEAVERHGALRGSLLAAWRVLRCHPFCRGGHDPVPQEFWEIQPSSSTAVILSEERSDESRDRYRQNGFSSV